MIPEWLWNAGHDYKTASIFNGEMFATITGVITLLPYHLIQVTATHLDIGDW